jgi:hypothetical protein
MSVHPDFNNMVGEIKAVREDLDGVLDRRDVKFIKRLESVEAGINELYKAARRPAGNFDHDDVDERKSAVDLCILKHDIDKPRTDGGTPEYNPSHAEIKTAIVYNKAIRSLLHHGNTELLALHLSECGQVDAGALSSDGRATE